MTTQSEIQRTEERLRDAFRAASAVMTVEHEATDTSLATRSRPGVMRRGGGWLMPVTAAACVVAVALTTVLVGRDMLRAAHAPGSATSASGVPTFYLTRMVGITRSGQVQIRRTSDGEVTATVPLPELLGVTSQVAADASGRAFYFVKTVHGCGSSGQSLVSAFVRVTITGEGRVAGTRIVGSAVPGGVQRFAVSPDGSQIAYTSQISEAYCGTRALPFPEAVLRIMDTATGAVRIWNNAVTASTPAAVRVIDDLSWVPDGRRLIVSYAWNRGGSFPRAQAALSLDASSHGGSLQASSRVVFRQDCDTCVTEIMAGPHENSLTVTQTQSELQGGGTRHVRLEVIHVPVGFGGQATVLYRAVLPGSTLMVSSTEDASAQHVIIWTFGGNSTVGWISNGKLIGLAAPPLRSSLFSVGW